MASDTASNRKVQLLNRPKAVRVSRAGRLRYIVAPAVLWALYVALIAGYAVIRSCGDSLVPWVDGRRLERAAFIGFEPVRILQSAFYGSHSRWLDFAGFVLHGAWFTLPLAFGIVITMFQRKRLLEYLGWVVTAAYIADIGYLLLPMRPPWMEPGIHRILLERSFVHYTQLDDNPVAAFPSLHAGLPLVIGLFFLLRCDRARRLGWGAVAFAGVMGVFAVYLGEHWVIDVLAGYALAGLVALLFMHPRLHALYDRLPFQPRRKLIALNEWLSTRDASPPPIERAQPELPLESDRAA